ncbi:MAG: hypothetical protein LBU99_03815 [Spirochaetaceae bacterium]|nr:hypothetical protein [Spirochaetaceae bacterium]
MMEIYYTQRLYRVLGKKPELRKSPLLFEKLRLDHTRQRVYSLGSSPFARKGLQDFRRSDTV